MTKITKKGTVLIIVSMIVLILSLLATGLFVIVTNDSKLANKDLNEAKLRFAAEGGVKALYHNLCRLTPGQIIKSDSKDLIGDGQELTINDMSVKMFAEKDAVKPIWKLWAYATDASGKICQVNLSNIIATTVLENSMVMTAAMDGTGTFVGQVNRVNGKLERHASADHFRGKTYFSGEINLGGVPWFDGSCTYAVKSADQKVSKHNGGASGNAWISNPLNGYSKGIIDAGYNSGWAGDAFGDENTYSNAVNMEARFNKMFENGSYNISDAPIDFSKSNYKWDDLTTGANLPSDLTVEKVNASNDGDIKVTFSVDGANKPWALIHGGGISNKKIDLSDCKVIALDTKNDASISKQVISVEGVIGSDITLAVDYGVVKLVGDVYYKGFESYTSLSQDSLMSANTNTKLKDINTKLNSGNYGKFGLINYHGHVLVDKGSNEADATGVSGGDKAVLFMGAIYAPDGQFGSAATSTAKFYKDYGATKATENRISSGFLQVVTIGSVMVQGKGLYKKGSTSGMASHFCPDPRYEAGIKPSGFPVTVKELSYDGGSYTFWQYATTEMTWKIEWK